MKKTNLLLNAALAALVTASVAVASGNYGNSPATKAAPEPSKGATKKATPDPQKAAAAEKVACYGANSCKGTSVCGVKGSHSCHGKNACKGKGMLKMSKEQCEKKDGSLTEPTA